MNAQAANLVLIFGPEALQNESAYPAITLLRAILQAAPEDLQKFHGQVEFIFPSSQAQHGVTDPKERACIYSLVAGVPEILFFLPTDTDAVPQLIYRLLPAAAINRGESEQALAVADIKDARQVVRPLLKQLKAAMARAELSEESFATRAGAILDLLGVDSTGHKEFLS